MCGIAGFTRFHAPLGDEQTLVAMGDAIRHRGPDASGSHIEEHVGLHHRRLSIIDLSEAGNQPMFSADKRFVIVFNGEIYNYLELREQLATDGYPFQTKTDTEVILALYAREGAKCLDSLNGMFAFAIWDTQAQTLFLARDRLGKKPLYYSPHQGDIAFASELKALMQCDWFDREINVEAVYDFMAYQYVPDPKTIFANTFKLEPGHYLEFDAKGLRKTQYWDASFRTEDISDADAIAQIRELIEAGTKRRMISDVPLGAFLSGGIDSSGIVAVMSKLNPEKITTCSIGFDNEEFNETEFAQLIAEHYETDHHEYKVTDNVAGSLREIVRFFDEPFGDPSLVPTYFVSKLARQTVTVAIAGDGGDEVFAGYEKYSTDDVENRWRERIPGIVRRGLFPSFARILRLLPIRVAKRGATLLTALSHEAAEAFFLSNSHVTDHEWGRISSPSTKAALGDYHPKANTLDRYNSCDGPDHLSRILYTDLKTYLPGGILVKVDRMSMAHSLEVRAPLLDYRLVEHASKLPSHMKYRSGIKKWLLKQVFEPNLPESVIHRKKMGFSVPLDQWFRHELKELTQQTLLDAKDGVPRYFVSAAIQEIWDEHQRKLRNHGSLLWSLLMFQLWWDNYMANP